ncbi:MAG: DNA polymerase III subunit delta [Desulfuromonadales bacterium]|nr:DNA polymerase III subunit delta [Desulfuromonadales bacterium]NIR33998.1 DNA polymerase III subunit delta [Desulfuromonadales bacterium]NIS42670.1 DNA polymerase III subunit delta [Desulfuromonadales bacterium]
MKPAELTKVIDSGRVPTLLYLYGEEAFLLEKSLRRLKDHLVAPEARDFNLVVLDARETSGAAIIDHARTLPVFAPHRLVIVNDSQHLKADSLETLRDYIREPVPETTLVFVADKVDKRRKFFQEFGKKGELVEFKGIYDNQLPGFVKTQARELGISFTEDALQRFCRKVGTNLAEVHGEMVKLKTYLGERDLVDVDDVAAIVSDSRVESIFELTNAVGRRRSGEALRLLQRMLDDGVAPLVILSMLVRHFRQLWKARELQKKGAPRNSLPRSLGVNPYFLDGILSQARQFSDRECRLAFELFLDADQALKSSGAHAAAVLEKVLLQLVAGGGRTAGQ